MPTFHAWFWQSWVCKETSKDAFILNPVQVLSTAKDFLLEIRTYKQFIFEKKQKGIYRKAFSTYYVCT